MTDSLTKVTVDGPEVSGSYVVAEHRDDGTLVLEPERERLSDVIAETDGQVFHDEDFIVRLERVAAAGDELPPEARRRKARAAARDQRRGDRSVR